MVKRKPGMSHEDTFLVYGNKKFQSPSYCDRILWQSHLSSKHVSQQYYTAIHECTQSDHRPVVAAYQVELKMPYTHVIDQFLDITPPTISITCATFIPTTHRTAMTLEDVVDEFATTDKSTETRDGSKKNTGWSQIRKSSKAKKDNKKKKDKDDKENKNIVRFNHDVTELSIEIFSDGCISGVANTEWVGCTTKNDATTAQYIWNEDMMTLTSIPLSVNNAVWLCNQDMTICLRAKGGDFGTNGTIVGHVIIGLHELFDSNHEPCKSMKSIIKDVMRDGRIIGTLEISSIINNVIINRKQAQLSARKYLKKMNAQKYIGGTFSKTSRNSTISGSRSFNSSLMNKHTRDLSVSRAKSKDHSRSRSRARIRPSVQNKRLYLGKVILLFCLVVVVVLNFLLFSSFSSYKNIKWSRFNSM
jgi:hypothetical protein